MVTSLVVKALILLLELGDTIVFLRLPVVELVLGRVNDNHAVFDRSCDLRLSSAFQSHVSNEI